MRIVIVVVIIFVAIMIILTVFYILRFGQCDHAGTKQETASEDNCDFEEQDINAEEFVYFSNKVEI